MNPSDIIRLFKAGILSKEEANKIIMDANDPLEVDNIMKEIEILKLQVKGLQEARDINGQGGY